MTLQPCAYLHNHPRDGEIDHSQYRAHLTSESVIAINLFGALITRRRNARNVSENAARRAVYEAKLSGTFTKI